MLLIFSLFTIVGFSQPRQVAFKPSVPIGQPLEYIVTFNELITQAGNVIIDTLISYRGEKGFRFHSSDHVDTFVVEYKLINKSAIPALKQPGKEEISEVKLVGHYMVLSDILIRLLDLNITKEELLQHKLIFYKMKALNNKGYYDFKLKERMNSSGEYQLLISYNEI